MASDRLATTEHSLPTATVMGFPVHLCSNYLGWLQQHLGGDRGLRVVTLNAEMVMQAQQQADLARVIRTADLVVPDGAGVVLYLRSRGVRVERCPGIELAEGAIAQAALQGCRVFLLGGNPEVLAAVTARWAQHYPGLVLVGAQHGYFEAREEAAIAAQLAERQPDLVLVGLGVPRQELWIERHASLCPRAVWIGVGGSFDIWSGRKQRAPQWMRDNHLEWAYRLYKEPWRWRRMLALPQFAMQAIAEALRQAIPGVGRP